MLNLEQLHCYGCAHSAASEPFPGKPSGERPCFFCIRNKRREEVVGALKSDGGIRPGHPAEGVWYDGTKAVRVPMDCYHSVDMKEQMQKWMDADRELPEQERGI